MKPFAAAPFALFRTKNKKVIPLQGICIVFA